MAKFEKGKEILLRFKSGIDQQFKDNLLNLLTTPNPDKVYYVKSENNLEDWILLIDPTKSISRKKLLGLIEKNLENI